jgi:hypothetical protein
MSVFASMRKNNNLLKDAPGISAHFTVEAIFLCNHFFDCYTIGIIGWPAFYTKYAEIPPTFHLLTAGFSVAGNYLWMKIAGI